MKKSETLKLLGNMMTLNTFTILKLEIHESTYEKMTILMQN